MVNVNCYVISVVARMKTLTIDFGPRLMNNRQKCQPCNYIIILSALE